MRILLDTHAFIQFDSTPEQLSSTARSLCQDTRHTLFLSIASVWEMQIKMGLGKLSLPRPLLEIVQWERQHNQIRLLPITLEHIAALSRLPDHHRDPFDRMLIAQAQSEALVILSRDRQLSRYPVQVVW